METKYQKKVKFASTPLPAKDNPEIDTSDYCNEEKKREYQSLIGMCIWAVTLGRIDICYATSSLGRFNAEPRIGQLERLWRSIGYLKKNPEKFIVIDSRNPEYNIGKRMSEKYMKRLYPDAEELIDESAPKGLVEEMEITIFVDAIMHMI